MYTTPARLNSQQLVWVVRRLIPRQLDHFGPFRHENTPSITHICRVKLWPFNKYCAKGTAWEIPIGDLNFFVELFKRLLEQFGHVFWGSECLLYERGQIVFRVISDLMAKLSMAVSYSEEVDPCRHLNIRLQQICILIQLFWAGSSGKSKFLYYVIFLRFPIFRRHVPADCLWMALLLNDLWSVPLLRTIRNWFICLLQSVKFL